MGYTTDFEGVFTLDKPLTPEHKKYLEQFSHTRRMKRNSSKTEKLADPYRKAVGLSVGIEGGYHVGTSTNFGQKDDTSIVEYNEPPSGQHSLWCDWTPTEDGTEIEWNGSEKFYKYVEWLDYIMRNFTCRWGYMMNGEVTWQGEDDDDIGRIIVANNNVSVLRGTAGMFRCWKCSSLISEETAKKLKGLCAKCAGDVTVENPSGRKIRP